MYASISNIAKNATPPVKKIELGGVKFLGRPKILARFGVSHILRFQRYIEVSRGGTSRRYAALSLRHIPKRPGHPSFLSVRTSRFTVGRSTGHSVRPCHITVFDLGRLPESYDIVTNRPIVLSSGHLTDYGRFRTFWPMLGGCVRRPSVWRRLRSPRSLVYTYMSAIGPLVWYRNLSATEEVGDVGVQGGV